MASPDTNKQSPEATRGQEGLVELGGKTYKARLITSGEFDPREDLKAGHRVFTAGGSGRMLLGGISDAEVQATNLYSTHHVSIKEAVLEERGEVVLRDFSLVYVLESSNGYRDFYTAAHHEDTQLEGPIAVGSTLDEGGYDGLPYHTCAKGILVLEEKVTGDSSGKMFSPDEIDIVWFLHELFRPEGLIDYEEYWSETMEKEERIYSARRSGFDRAAAKLAAAKKAAIEGAVGRD